MPTVSGKRKKEPVIHGMREALEGFHDLVEDYREDLERELAAARAGSDPYPYLIRAVERQIVALRKLETLLEEGVWPEVISLANGSASIAHTRTREFF